MAVIRVADPYSLYTAPDPAFPKVLDLEPDSVVQNVRFKQKFQNLFVFCITLNYFLPLKM
jgi:hypothetical protein